MNTQTLELTVRSLGRTGLRVSPLGVAGLSMAKGPKPRKDGLSARDVERAFHELGINTFLVHPWMPSIMEGVRKLIRSGLRDDLVLISEASIPIPGFVRRGLRANLRALGTDYLDAWLFGWVRARWHLRPSVWDAFHELKFNGDVRAIGFSSHNRLLAARLTQELSPDVLMIRYNAAHRGAEREVFATLPTERAARPGVIAYTATRWGMLLEGVPNHEGEAALPAPDCYRFALTHPSVDMVWCAARSFEELAEDVAGARLGALAEPHLTEVRQFGDAVHAAARGGRRWMFGHRSD